MVEASFSTTGPAFSLGLPAIASQLGNRIAEVVVNHRPRRFGRSKYGLSRTFRVVADLLTLRRLMREAIAPGAPRPPIYEVAALLEYRPGLLGAKEKKVTVG